MAEGPHVSIVGVVQEAAAPPWQLTSAGLQASKRKIEASTARIVCLGMKDYILGCWLFSISKLQRVNHCGKFNFLYTKIYTYCDAEAGHFIGATFAVDQVAMREMEKSCGLHRQRVCSPFPGYSTQPEKRLSTLDRIPPSHCYRI